MSPGIELTAIVRNACAVWCPSSAPPCLAGQFIGPRGQLLAGPKYGEECILTADIDRAEITRAKFDFDVVGHYSRPDVFRLEVNEQPMKSVTFR